VVRKQSAKDRIKRINEGRCPIHGVSMTQVSCWDKQIGGALDSTDVCVVECPRRDCHIQAVAASADGPWELLPEWDPLLAGE
jgi:hypothetical protein